MNSGNNILKLVDATPEAPTYRLQDQIGFILRRAHQRHVSIFGSHIDEFTPQQFATLAMLLEAGETPQTQLGQLIAMDAATLKGVLDRLKARGYVAIRKDGDDRRRLFVSLTSSGSDAVSKLIPLAKRLSGDTLRPLNAREVDQLLRLLAKIS